MYSLAFSRPICAEDSAIHWICPFLQTVFDSIYPLEPSDLANAATIEVFTVTSALVTVTSTVTSSFTTAISTITTILRQLPQPLNQLLMLKGGVFFFSNFIGKHGK